MVEVPKRASVKTRAKPKLVAVSNGIERYGSKWVAGNRLTSLTSYLRCGSNFQWTVGALLIAAVTTTIFNRWNVKSWPIFLRCKSKIR